MKGTLASNNKVSKTDYRLEINYLNKSKQIIVSVIHIL